MPFPFPPGDTTWAQRRPQSPWREFAFVFYQIQRAFEPPISLHEVVMSWNEIARSLAECPRKRKIQVHAMFD